MRHLTVSSFGTALGISGERLVVHESGGLTWETALSRLRTIRIEKQGVSVSTNLMLACAARGIRLYVVDWRGVGVVALSGLHQHAVVSLREAQFAAVRSDLGRSIAREMITAKIRNQRAVLLYFWKYLTKSAPDKAERLRQAADQMADFAVRTKGGTSGADPAGSTDSWAAALMGSEGAAAALYWQTLREAELVPATFLTREGRGSVEIVNSALNYGYAMLQSYVWSALDNAGFELYAGFLHSQRPGKPSLVLDVMEEYRAWVVDRNVIKLRAALRNSKRGLTPEIKASIVKAVDDTMASFVTWQGKSVRLENALQRQAYRLAGTVVDGKRYKSIRFRW
ncbi:CRISPR-associated endonuclease Cas1 [uncultured Sutterella sp.]|uniref:CRISPR-associated endonuclease Cas1 n=1 Tax=uncultured Sutterella sp. TaxID=286133 RepID=UPI0025F1EDCD|nr:CRISPR-associated endonuclease Cas1 [uncultured Sutterella sp.]